MSRARLIILGIAASAALGASRSLFAQGPSPARPPSGPVLIAPEAAMRIAVERLRAEGRAFRATGNLPRQQADFARTYAYVVRPTDVVEAVAQVQDPEDAAVDAYIRWQLLSFQPDLAGMDSELYQRLLRNLPRLARDPASDPEVHEQFESLTLPAGRSAEIRVDLQRRWDALRFESSQVELLNQPALKFREAVAEAMPDTGLRRLGVLLRDLEDRIRAASSTRGVKSRISALLRARMTDETLGLEQRWGLIRHIEQLRGPETRIVRDVVFYVDAPADVRYSTFAVRSADVARWTAYLNRHEP